MELKAYEIYSIEVDTSNEYTQDKVVINQQRTKEFFTLLKQFQNLEVSGFYGELQEVQKKLFTLFSIKSLVNCTIGKGKIFGLQKENKVFFCLILEDNFFLQKPIDEKTILLTLFRIFLDLVNCIHLCVRQEVFSQWYQGTFVPFSTSAAETRQEFILDCPKNLVQEEKTFNLIVPLINSLNMTIIPQPLTLDVIYGEVKEFNQSQQKYEFERQYKILAQQIINKWKNGEHPYIDEMIRNQIQKQFQTSSLRQTLLDLEKYYVQLNIKGIDINDQETAIIQNTFEQINFRQDDLVKFNFTKGSFKIIRSKNPQQNDVEKIQFHSEDSEITQYFQKNSSGKQQKGTLPILKNSFKTKENNEIFLFLDTSVKQHNIYIFTQKQEWRNLGSICYSENSVFYFNQKQNYLFCFNLLNNKKVTKHEVSDKKIMLSEVGFYEQVFKEDESQEDIIVEQVSYLFLSKQFIILSQNQKIYTLSETSKTFKLAKLKPETQNYQKSIDYKQLLTCPSGKYFYLSDYHSCNMFDCNLNNVKRFEIQGKVIVMCDKQDVLLVSLFNQNQIPNQTVVVKMIANLIETGAFTKVLNEEKIIKGNPVIDIFRGSWVKFGPFFTYQQCQRNIKLIVLENQQKMLINDYLNKLNLSEFFIQLQNEHLNSIEQFENLQCTIYTRVPLQLCTIDNNRNFIPLINGFRQNFTETKNL